MKTTFLFASPRVWAAVALGLGQATFSFSHEETDAALSRPDSHAPIGVMGDHLHRSGEFMLSYRHMQMRMEGHRQGTDDLSSHEVFDLGYTAAATSMDMSMDMFGLMYAPSDRVTLMLMANYLNLEMEMVGDPHAMDAGHGHGGMAGMSAMDHATSGWGDTSVTALIRAWEAKGHRVHWNVGLSAPTGSVEEMMHGMFQPYGMQLGSGTWDARLGATYTGSAARFSWGGQVLGVIRLQDSGPSGFSRGDAYEATAWGAWRLMEGLSVSSRLRFTTEGDLEGHYHGPHGHSAPPHLQANYGGEIGELLFGLNAVIPSGWLRGQRLALEVGLPVSQDLNGVGMTRKETVSLGWQAAW